MADLHMAGAETEPVTPEGRILAQPNLDSVINCTIAFDHPLDPDFVRVQLSNSLLTKHPRFCSLMVRDSWGREHWRKTQVDLDRHLIINHHRLTSENSDEDAVSDYVADLCFSSPLSADKPLWEVHLLLAHNAAIFRLHHALGDGVTLMPILLSCCGRMDDSVKSPPQNGGGRGGVAATATRNVWTNSLKMVWYTLVYVIEFMLRGWFLKDKTTVMSGGAGVEFWPRRLATARFHLEDLKIVKGAVANATINDVLTGVVSSGLSKYLDIRSPKALPEGHQLTGLAMVNLRPPWIIQDLSKLMSVEWYGNQFGMMLYPVHYHGRGSDPIQFVKIAKSTMDKKKLGLQTSISYKIGKLIISTLGAKVASTLTYRLLCNTTFIISNIVGPREEITFAGNPVKYIRVTGSSTPQGISMHIVSYSGVFDMQIQVAKELIPDPKVLARCFEKALLEMKEAAAKN